MGDDGIYLSAPQRRRRRGTVAVAVAVAAVLLGVGAYVGTSWYLGRPSALEPFVTPSVAPPVSATPSVVPQSAPVAPPLGTISAARASRLPSPVPSPTAPTDDELADTQVSRLLQPRSGITAADSATVVRNEITPGGALARIVSARYDLTSRRQLLGAADAGEPIGQVRCTQNFRVQGAPFPQNRPGLLLCWRMSPYKSVVVIATSATKQPQAPDAAAVVSHVWTDMG
ncbi:hypothetical protein ODJ79_15510 [Actinoplanes sp. KI2]|uniref:hypothetical protein n=1 Tax=Actinoplanes sp. KI2 TaxID=2983315 RepID=UPI0021D5A2EB|nr:hypothetical protein [Actinoplanes sp. KI2]MCU7725134.1 hypothetical protein [Actinoplanes sp. KI2]